MPSARAIEVEVGGSEDAATTFARDQWTALRTADDGVARARVWRRRGDGLILGRFHRADPEFLASAGATGGGVAAQDSGGTGAAHGTAVAHRGGVAAHGTAAANDGGGAASNGGGLSRRLSGGRVVVGGPGVVCITLVAPLVDWLDPSGRALRPEQILNRAVRPMLALLRADGIDAFYPGRDLVTVAGRTIAHASFTVMRDGLAIVEMHVAEAPVFPTLTTLLDRFDPAGIAGVDRDAFRGATSVEETKTAARSDDEWASRFAAFAATSFACEVRDAGASSDFAVAPSRTPDGVAGAADASSARTDALVTLAHDSAVRDFLSQPGPVADGTLGAATVSMLGAVECSGRLRGDRLTDLRITGDLIAPFHTIDDIATECEGQPFRADYVRKALARALGRPRSFLLGLKDLDELILRLA